jgi:hypothetical protein
MSISHVIQCLFGRNNATAILPRVFSLLKWFICDLRVVMMSLRLNLLDQRSSSFITSYDSTSVFCKWKLYKCHWRCSWCQQNVSLNTLFASHTPCTLSAWKPIWQIYKCSSTNVAFIGFNVPSTGQEEIHTRCVIERTFGIWKMRFRCIYRGLTSTP